MEVLILAIFGAIIFKTAIDVMILKDTKKLKKTTEEYPLKEEYEQNVKEIQFKELQSDKFKHISNFMIRHDNRKNIDLENELFKIVGNGIEDDLIDENFDVKKSNIIKRFDLFKKFINSLSQEQIDSNLYLKAAERFMNISIMDCKYIISNLRKQIDTDSNFKRIEIDVEIPERTLEFLPTRISETTIIPYYDPELYKTSCVNLLDDENKHIYSRYNKYASKIDRLANDIYLLQMWNLLSDYPEQIDNYYFHFLNNSIEHKFLVGYFVKQNIPLVKSYEVSNKTKKVISKLVGLPFEEIIKMSVDELDKYLENKFGMKLNRDLEWIRVLPDSQDKNSDERHRISFNIK